MQVIIRAKTCVSCGYQDKQGSEMHCHARPPTVVPIIQADRSGRPYVAGNVTICPVVSPDMWCGEHRPRIAVDSAPASSMKGVN